MSSSGAPFSLAILEAGPLAPALAERYGSHAAFFRRYLGPKAPDMSMPSFPVYLDTFPSDPEAHDAYLITGSRYSVYDPLPWIPRLKAFVRDVAETRPVVGICFGHQLVAEAFGGKVEKAAVGWGIGLHRYRVASGSVLRSRPGGGEDVALIASHQDQVVVPPPGAEILAGSAFCPIGAMKIGANVLSIQLHPEMPADYARDLYEMRRPIIGSEQIDRAKASLEEPTDAPALADWLIDFVQARRI